MSHESRATGSRITSYTLHNEQGGVCPPPYLRRARAREQQLFELAEDRAGRRLRLHEPAVVEAELPRHTRTHEHDTPTSSG